MDTLGAFQLSVTEAPAKTRFVFAPEQFDCATNGEQVDALEAEADWLANDPIPGVEPVLEVRRAGSRLTVFSAASGASTLSDVLRRHGGRLTLVSTLGWLLPALETIPRVHARWPKVSAGARLLRCLTPERILITPEGGVLLRLVPSWTRHCGSMGSLESQLDRMWPYAPPALLLDRPWSEGSDVFSAMRVAHECLHGPIAQPKSELARFEQTLQEPLPRLGGEVPAVVADLFAEALDKKAPVGDALKLRARLAPFARR